MAVINRTILIPRPMDADKHAPQTSNAKNMVARFNYGVFQVNTFHYDKPWTYVQYNPSIRLIKLWRWRFRNLSAWLAYQGNIDAVFYPGGEVRDDLGWRFRDITMRRVPIIATLEGLVGNSAREVEYSEWAGHPVYCQHVDDKVLARLDRLYERADHVIAISPFLAKMGRRRYGNKFSVIPLGIDTSVFFSLPRSHRAKRLRVISVGRVASHKRPELFLELARCHREVDFIWYGNGDEERETLLVKSADLGLRNLMFPGEVSPEQLADALRQADLFVMPSRSEGVPKVTQEAAACGLPVVLFGYYDAPSVVHGHNGYVVWDDDTFFQAVSTLLLDQKTMQKMGYRGAEMAKDWCWGKLALQWERKLIDLLA